MWDHDAGRSLTMLQSTDHPASIGENTATPKTAASFYRSSRSNVVVGTPSSMYSLAGNVNSIRSHCTNADSQIHFRDRDSASATGAPRSVAHSIPCPSSTHSAALPDLRLAWEAAGRMPDMVRSFAACADRAVAKQYLSASALSILHPCCVVVSVSFWLVSSSTQFSS